MFKGGFQVTDSDAHRGRDRISHFRDESAGKRGLWDFLFGASGRSACREGRFRKWAMAVARSARLKNKRCENSSKCRRSCSFEQLRAYTPLTQRKLLIRGGHAASWIPRCV